MHSSSCLTATADPCSAFTEQEQLPTLPPAEASAASHCETAERQHLRISPAYQDRSHLLKWTSAAGLGFNGAHLSFSFALLQKLNILLIFFLLSNVQ